MTDDVTPATGNILIIDDVPDNLRFLSDLLTKGGYIVRKVMNGELGIESALLEPPDLILLDIRMPGVNGYQVCDRLKQSDRTCNIPVIFLSALDEEAEKVMAFQAGGVDYIIKPFQVVEVLARIETHLRISRLQQQLQQKNEQLNQAIEHHNSAKTALALLNQRLELTIQERTTVLQAEKNQLLNLQTELQKALMQEKRRSASKSQWIQTITRTFRDPISTILTASAQLQKSHDRSTASQAYLHAIATTAESMQQSLQDVSLLLDADAQKLPLNLQPLDLTQFCRSLTQEWRLPSQPAYHLLFVSFGQSPETVLMDQSLLRPILTHLISNAVRYSPKGGTILVELSYETTQIILRVRDEGIGIPSEEQSRIFDRFYRCHEAEIMTGTANGLGLSVVKQAIERHGGTIEISSTIGQGSTFTVMLPQIGNEE
jgi:two-component system, sensor histidine kinase and response regulator